MDFRALLQNQWFQLCLVVAVISGGTSVFNLAQPGTPRPPSPGPTPFPGPMPTRVPGPFPTPTPFTKLKPKTAGRWIVDANGAADADSRTLVAIIGSLSDGDVVTIRPGDYFGGIGVAKNNVRFVCPEPIRAAENLLGGGNRGDASTGGATLHAQGTDTVLVNAKNVAFENLRIEQDTPGNNAALRILGESRVEVVNCQVRTKSRFAGVVIGNASLEARDSVFQNPGGSSGLQLENNSRGTLTRCMFSSSLRGFVVIQNAQAQLTGCVFQDDGQTDGNGGALLVEGGQAQLSANQCRFTTNKASVIAKEGGTLSLTDCLFNNNGVTGEIGNASAGVISAQSGSRVTLRGSTFENNKQGIIGQRGSTLVLERVQIRGTGLATDNKGLIYYCYPVAISGQGCTARIAGSSIGDSLSNSIVVGNGAQLTMLETTVSNAGTNALVVGTTDGAGKATINNVKIVGARNFGVWVNSGSECEAQGCQILGFVNAGFKVDGEKSTGRIADSSISGGNRDGLALWAHTGGTLTATGCTVEANTRGAQAGTGTVGQGGTVLLENCTVRGNTVWGVGACRDSLLTMRGGFLGNQRQNTYQERGGRVQLER